MGTKLRLKPATKSSSRAEKGRVPPHWRHALLACLWPLGGFCAPGDSIYVDTDEHLVTIRADQQSRADVLAELAQALKLDLTVTGLESTTISVEFEGLTTEQAIHRIFRDTSFTLFIDPATNRGWLLLHGNAARSTRIVRLGTTTKGALERVSQLAEADEVASVETIEPFAHAENWAARAEAAHALGEAESLRATALLGKLLQDSHIQVQRAAVDALLEQGHTSAIQELGNALPHAGRNLKLSIVEALANADDQTAVAYLSRTAQGDPVKIVREAAQQALEDVRRPR